MNKEVEALLIERRAYEIRGLKDRVSDVDQALRALGYKKGDAVESASLEPAVERSVKAKVKKRKV